MGLLGNLRLRRIKKLCLAIGFAPQSIRDNNGSLINHHRYLFSSRVPILRFEDHTIWFTTVSCGTSHTPCHPFGLISVGSIVSMYAHRFFCQEHSAFAFWTLIVLFVKLFTSHFGSFDCVFGPTIVIFVFGNCPSRHYITLMNMPINMVTIRPVKARM